MLHPLEAPFAEQRTEVPLAYPTHEARVTLTKILIDIGGRHQLRCLPLARQAEVLAAMLLYGWDVAVGTVAQLDVNDLLGGEVMALATVQQVHTLRIELFVLDGRVHIDHLRQLHAEEAAAARGVGEQVGRVAGADERGYARQRGGIAGVCLAHAQRGHLHQVLQRALLACRVAVILIEVDEQAVRQAALTLALGREVEVVRVEHPQLGRQQQSAEGALVPSLLLTDEDGCHAVRIQRIVLALRLRHEGQQPATEVAHHHLIPCEATHEGADAIHAIPLGQRAEEGYSRAVQACDGT